jgi:hypothetical protein
MYCLQKGRFSINQTRGLKNAPDFCNNVGWVEDVLKNCLNDDGVEGFTLKGNAVAIRYKLHVCGRIDIESNNATCLTLI